MAGVSTPVMAAEVTKAGGLGSLGVGATDAEGARAMIAAFRKATNGPLNVNLFCHELTPSKAPTPRSKRPGSRGVSAGIRGAWGRAPPAALSEIYRSFLDDEAMFRMLLDERPAVVSFHFGLPPAEWIRRLRDNGAVLLATATNLAEARAIAACGLDGIVAQGWEAGGHRGVFDPNAADDQLGTLALTRLLVRTFDLPVIAAGGIMDGAGIAAARHLGAAAAQLGTAFIGTEESQADAGFRAALASDAAQHTTMTRRPFPAGWRAASPNRFTALSATVAARDEIAAYPIAYDLGKALNAAAKAKGEFGFGAQWAGQGAPLARADAGRSDLVGTLAAELGRASNFFFVIPASGWPGARPVGGMTDQKMEAAPLCRRSGPPWVALFCRHPDSRRRWKRWPRSSVMFAACWLYFPAFSRTMLRYCTASAGVWE